MRERAVALEATFSEATSEHPLRHTLEPWYTSVYEIDWLGATDGEDVLDD